MGQNQLAGRGAWMQVGTQSRSRNSGADDDQILMLILEYECVRLSGLEVVPLRAYSQGIYIFIGVVS